MPIHQVQYSLSVGAVSETFRGRREIERYGSALDVCENVLLLPKGGGQSRPGTERIGTPSVSDRASKLMRFEFNIEQVYVLVFGHEVVDFYFADETPVLDSALQPLTLSTPYQESELEALQVAQLADLLTITHENHPPARITRLDFNRFRYDPITFRPPPFIDRGSAGTAAANLSSPGANLQVTTNADQFVPGDIGRQLSSGSSRGRVVLYTGPREVFIEVIAPFALNPFGNALLRAGEWRLEGPPVATLSATVVSPVGDETVLTLSKDQPGNPNIIASASPNWVSRSPRVLRTGVTTVAGSDTTLIDLTATFESFEIEPGHVAINVSDATRPRDSVAQVLSNTSLLTTSQGANWAAGISYVVQDTSFATTVGSQLRLHGGANGTGHLDRQIATVAGRQYRIRFNVSENTASLMVGTASDGADLLAEATYPIGNDHEAVFIATGTAAFITFRNNQNNRAFVDNVSVRDDSLDGFRDPEDVGKLVAVRGGIVEITEILDPTRARAVIWANMSQAAPDSPNFPGIEPAIPGAWVVGEPSWSVSNGYPRALTYHDGRLWFLGSTQQPLTAWGSQTGLFDNFAIGANDSDAVEVELSSNTMNAIQWAHPFRDLFFGTAGDLSLLTGGNNPITPSNKAQVPQDDEGSAPVRPLRSGNRLFQLSRGQRKIRELQIDTDTGLSSIGNLTELHDHITESGIRNMVLQTQPYTILWAIRRDGQLVTYTLDVAEEVRGASRMITDGQFESLLVVPRDVVGSETTEVIWATVNRGGTRQIEVFRPDEVATGIRKARLTLDSAVRYSGVETQVITGLGHLEGREVTAVGREEIQQTDRRGVVRTVDRLTNLGTFTVTGGSITLNETWPRVDIGPSFTPRIVTLPPELDLRDGSLLARKTRFVRVSALVHETIGLNIEGALITNRDVASLMDTGLVPESGLLSNQGGQGWDMENRITIEQPGPFPFTILALVGEIEFGDSE